MYFSQRILDSHAQCAKGTRNRTKYVNKIKVEYLFSTPNKQSVWHFFWLDKLLLSEEGMSSSFVETLYVHTAIILVFVSNLNALSVCKKEAQGMRQLTTQRRRLMDVQKKISGAFWLLCGWKINGKHLSFCITHGCTKMHAACDKTRLQIRALKHWKKFKMHWKPHH